MRVLVIEDDADTLQLLMVYFEAKGHQVTSAHDGVAALKAFRAVLPNMVLLGIRLPHLDGWSVLEAIRVQSKVPVIILTALARADDAVKGLSLGADDYLRKPFHLNELEARIQAILRRSSVNVTPLLRVGPCQIDERTKSVRIRGKSVPLSPKEYKLLRLLASDPGRVFSNEEIIARLWPMSAQADVNNVKQCVYLLRSKVEEASLRPHWIETVKGFGYKLTC